MLIVALMGCPFLLSCRTFEEVLVSFSFVDLLMIILGQKDAVVLGRGENHSCFGRRRV